MIQGWVQGRKEGGTLAPYLTSDQLCPLSALTPCPLAPLGLLYARPSTIPVNKSLPADARGP
jgi:hypothetical protein